MQFGLSCTSQRMGSGTYFCFAALETLLVLEQLPTQCLLKEFEDIYCPSGEGMMNRVSSRQTEKAWEGAGRGGGYRALKVSHIYQGIWSAMHIPRSECMH